MSFEDEIIASPVNVPGSWARRRLGDVLPLAYGKALHARVRSIDGKIPVYGSAGIAGYHDEALCHEAGLIVGRKGSAGSTYHSQIPFFPIDTAYYCTKSRADMDLRLGYHLLTHLNLRQLDQSTAVPSLGRDTYNDIVVAVPPKSEQASLAARIDELFNEIDDGEVALAQARSNLATWRKSLLKAAVTGDLTADWRAANPATPTALEPKRLLDECSGQQFETADWRSISLGTVVSIQGGSAFRSQDYSETGIFLIRIGDIAQGSVMPTAQSARLPLRFLDRNPSFEIFFGDILIAMSGATTAKFGRYRSAESALLNQRVGRFRRISEKDLNLEFLEIWLAYKKDAILSASYGGAQPNISPKTIEALKISLPPLLEQEEIAAIANRALNLLDHTMTELTALEVCAATLRQSILADAFSGKLVT